MNKKLSEIDVKIAKPVRHRRANPLVSILKNNMNNDLLYQLAVIFLTLNSNGSMERQFRSVGVKVDKMREISQMLDGAVQSVRSISEMRGQIKQLMQKDYNKQ